MTGWGSSWGKWDDSGWGGEGSGEQKWTSPGHGGAAWPGYAQDNSGAAWGTGWGKQGRGQRSGWDSATYLGGKSKGDHALPLEERCAVLRELVMRWSQGRDDEAGAPVVKLSTVTPLSWPAEVVDAALYLLCGVPRRTALRSLGGGEEAVVANLLDAFLTRSNDEYKEELVQFLNESSSGDPILARAVEQGFLVGDRIDPRGVAGRGSLGQGGQGGGAGQPTRELRPQNTDEALERVEKKRKIAEHERVIAEARMATAKARLDATSVEQMPEHTGHPGPAKVAQAGPHLSQGDSAHATLGQAGHLLRSRLSPPSTPPPSTPKADGHGQSASPTVDSSAAKDRHAWRTKHLDGAPLSWAGRPAQSAAPAGQADSAPMLAIGGELAASPSNLQEQGQIDRAFRADLVEEANELAGVRMAELRAEVVSCRRQEEAMDKQCQEMAVAIRQGQEETQASTKQGEVQKTELKEAQSQAAMLRQQLENIHIAHQEEVAAAVEGARQAHDEAMAMAQQEAIVWKSECAELEQSLSSVHAAVGKQAMEISRQRAQISECNEEVAQWATKLQDRDAELANMAEAEVAMRGDVSMAQSQVAEQAAEMATLRRDHDEAMVAAQSVLARKEAEMATLRASLAEAEEKMQLAAGAAVEEGAADPSSDEPPAQVEGLAG